MRKDAVSKPSSSQAPSNVLPVPTVQFRLRAWREFQRALDPLAQPKPLRIRHH